MTFEEVMTLVGATKRYGRYYLTGFERNNSRPQRIAERFGKTAIYTTCTLPLVKNPICDADYGQQWAWIIS